MSAPASWSRTRSGLALLAALLTVPACADQSALLDAARRTFDVYQSALLDGNPAALRSVLSLESRVLVPSIPFERARGTKRLTVLSADHQPPQILLAVEDPNDAGRRTTYVLVKEDGDLRVDLVATAAYNHEQVAAANPGPTLEPRTLSPDELARIRSQQPESFR